jgi:predicted  nucleic acid-binding Zn-ribbon protein
MENTGEWSGFVKKPKLKAKDKNKKRSLKVKEQEEIIINEVAGSLTDNLKIILWNRWKSLPQLEKLLTGMESTSDKLSKNLLRSLEHNPCFVEKDGKWGVDSYGQELNNDVYQWLLTIRSPLTFKELKSLAKENGVELGEEKDLVWDSRFIRYKSGRWGLSCWKLAKVPGRKELKELLREIEQNGAPMEIERVSDFYGINISKEKLLSVLEQSGLFIRIKPNLIFSKRVFNKLLDKLSITDPLELFRQAEEDVLQEAELMLIIKDNNPTKRQYILSSWDLETGKLSLTKRMSKVFRDFPEVCYLKINLKGQTRGVWYFAQHSTLFDLKDWYEENKLGPGHILELSWTEGKVFPTFELKITGEREAEVYSEGKRVMELASFCCKARYEQLDLESALFGIMEFFPGGLHLDYIRQALKLAEIKTVQLESLLQAYPFFEELGSQVWRCNLAMKNSYFDFLNQIKYVQDELETARKEVAGSMAEVLNLQTEKDNLHEELTYLQKVHREEQALYQEKLSELAIRSEHYQIENAKLKNDLERLKDHERELLQEIHIQGEQLISLRKEKNKFKVRTEQLENKVIQVQGNLARTLEDAETEIIRLKKQVAEKTSQVDSLQYANRELQKNLARLHEERRDMKRKLSCWPVRIILTLLDLGNSKSKAVSG